MYPNELFFGIHLYEILILLGILVAFLILRYFTLRLDFSTEATKFYFNTSGISLIFGILGAVLLQDIYNFIATGKFKFMSGMTFLGGLTTAIFVFILIYHFKANQDTKRQFKDFLCIAPISVAFAHGIGRIGCFTAGCCHGKPSNIGFIFKEGTSAYNLYGAVKVFPTQLVEAIFLFILGSILFFLLYKRKFIGYYVYLIAYGCFRFILEIFRGDIRGGFANFLSPSQFISILLIILGIFLIIKSNKKEDIIKKD